MTINLSKSRIIVFALTYICWLITAFFLGANWQLGKHIEHTDKTTKALQEATRIIQEQR